MNTLFYGQHPVDVWSLTFRTDNSLEMSTGDLVQIKAEALEVAENRRRRARREERHLELRTEGEDKKPVKDSV